jgi:hypothetical protein
MKFAWKSLCFLCVLCGASLCLSLDREAFSITNYALTLQIEPEQHRLGARGKISLRNDKSTPQKIAVLQISSSLDWRAIRAGDKALQFVTQPYTSDIDHTGSLSEAIITLPHEVAAKGTIDLNIAYEGVILLDTTRLTRIGTPEDVARASDWDRIDENFTAVRGAGYVAWYPIATESASLSEATAFSEVVNRWKERETFSEMSVCIQYTKDYKALFSGTKDVIAIAIDAHKLGNVAAFSMIRPGGNVPTFALADYQSIDVKSSSVNFLAGKEALASSYADLLTTLNPLPALQDPIGVQIAQLPEIEASPFVSDGLLLTPLQPLKGQGRLTLVYALSRRKLSSPRPWINEGLAHFAQAYDIEQQHGRAAALAYLEAHLPLLATAELERSQSVAESATPTSALINTRDDIYLQSKAMWVWWMLRDMIGESSLNIVLSSYRNSEDNDPTYMPRLIAAQNQRDLSWFFDDWLYHDRGLPDFKVESAYAARTPTKSFMLTLTLDNLGTAAAEVPVIVKFAGGEITKRVELHAKSKLTFRIETPAAPQEVKVNDGSVPESDLTNNSFKLPEPVK